MNIFTEPTGRAEQHILLQTEMRYKLRCHGQILLPGLALDPGIDILRNLETNKGYPIPY